MNGETGRPHASTVLRILVVAVAVSSSACGTDRRPTVAPSAAAPTPAGRTGPQGVGRSHEPRSPSPPTVVAPSPARGGSPATAPPSSRPTSPIPATAGSLPFGFAAKGMSHEVIAFATVPQLQYVATTMDLSAVSTVAFFGLTVTRAGELAVRNTAGRAWSSALMTRVIGRAHSAGTRVVATIGRFSWTARGTMASRAVLGTESRRQRLATAIARTVDERRVDGVNLDFEPIPTGFAESYADLVARVRRSLDRVRPGLQLTVALVGHFDSYDVPAILRARPDALYLMAYHYAGWWSSVAGSTAPLGGEQYDVRDAVRLLLRWVPPGRLIVGAPYYGHLWPTTSGSPHARTTGRGTDLTVAAAARLMEGRAEQWDALEHVAWGAWQARDCPTCARHWVELYYDSPRATADKWRWIKAQGLLGAGIWTIGFEGEPGRWNTVLRNAFLAPR